MDILTYSLKSGESIFSQYYEDITKFTDEVIIEMNNDIGAITEDFQKYVAKNAHEFQRSKLEYEIELLVLGILWKQHIKRALGVKKFSADMLSSLALQREKNGAAKIYIDYFSGILKNLFLMKEDTYLKDVPKTIENMDKLLVWMAASGDYNYAVKRLRHWKNYLSFQSSEKVIKCITKTLELADYFEKSSSTAIGGYTERVDKFLENDYLKHKWKEDVIYCGSKRVEYHLNMVGAEIMNRAFRENFLKTEEKRVLLPSCMRFNNNGKCRAEKTSKGYICCNCTFKCNVNKLSKMGEKHGFRVYIIPHESTPFTKERLEEGKIGVVGIACVLNLISGGWKARELGFVPQCVLLDYCGCKKHWDKEGIMTDINLTQFEKVIGTF